MTNRLPLLPRIVTAPALLSLESNELSINSQILDRDRVSRAALTFKSESAAGISRGRIVKLSEGVQPYHYLDGHQNLSPFYDH